MADFKRALLFKNARLGTSATVATNVALDANNKRLAWVFSMPEAATLTIGQFRYGARTGTPPTYRISLQAVDASGNPDGTVLGGASPVSATFTPPASTAWDGTTQEVTFANAYTCTRGQILALVIDYSAGTVDGTNNGSFTADWGTNHGLMRGFPNRQYYDGAAWAKAFSQASFAVKSASKAFGYPQSAAVGGVTAVEAGLKFTLPDIAQGYQVVGVFFPTNFTAVAATTTTVTLYDTDDTTVLQAVTLDNDILSAGAAHWVDLYFDEVTLSTLTPGSTYSLGLSYTGAITRTTYVATVSAAADWIAWDGEDSAYYVSRATAGTGAWTADTTKRLLAGVYIDTITETAAGGIMRHPGMGGGFSG